MEEIKKKSEKMEDVFLRCPICKKVYLKKGMTNHMKHCEYHMKCKNGN